MKILLVGNILKDVYLNLDSRTETFETDQDNTKWLDIGFNTSEHHFFNRESNFGGSAISLEVLKKMGLVHCPEFPYLLKNMEKGLKKHIIMLNYV